MRRVVILGGGFGGLYAAKALAREPLEITLVDRRNHHLFQPLLYQVATATLNPSDIAVPIRSVLRNRKNVRVLLGEAARVDPHARRVHLTDGAVLAYDFLIVATGATHSYFGHPEWSSVAPGLKSVEDALEIRKRVFLAYEAAERIDRSRRARGVHELRHHRRRPHRRGDWRARWRRSRATACRATSAASTPARAG